MNTQPTGHLVEFSWLALAVAIVCAPLRMLRSR